MADLSDITSAQSIKVVGSDSSGVEQTPVQSTANGGLHINVRNNAGTEIAVATETTLAAMASNITSILANQTNGLQQAKIVDMNGTGTLFYDLDTTGASAYAMGVSLRRTTAGTPVEVGTLTTPLYTSPIAFTSYSASATFSVAATPTDVFTITGSSGKTVFLTKVTISGTTTAGSGISTNITLVKRSALDTGGTSVVITDGPFLTGVAASGVTARNYTANPAALGASVFAVKAQRYSFVTAGTQIQPLIWDWSTENLTMRPSLSSTTENFAINFGSTSITGSAVAIDMEYIVI